MLSWDWLIQSTLLHITVLHVLGASCLTLKALLLLRLTHQGHGYSDTLPPPVHVQVRVLVWCSYESQRGGRRDGSHISAVSLHCCASQSGHVCGHWQLQRLQGHQVKPQAAFPASPPLPRVDTLHPNLVYASCLHRVGDCLSWTAPASGVAR